MALLSPGVAVNITDSSVYTTKSSKTIPLFFIATKYGKTQPNSNVLCLGTLEAGVPRLVTSIKESLSLYGMPIFYKDVYNQQFHADSRNEFGLLALNQYLKNGNTAYVIRADIDLDDNIENLKLLWEQATTNAVNVAKQTFSSYVMGKYNDGGDVRLQGIAKSPIIPSDYIDPITGFIAQKTSLNQTLLKFYKEESDKNADVMSMNNFIDASIGEFKKSTAAFRDKYELLSNIRFNLSSIVAGNFATVEILGLRDGNNYPVVLSKPYVYNATNDSNEAAKNLISPLARSVRKDRDIPWTGENSDTNYPNDDTNIMYDTTKYLGIKGLLAKHLNATGIFKFAKPYTSTDFDILDANIVSTGYTSDNYTLSLTINKLYGAREVPDADKTYYAVGDLEISGEAYVKTDATKTITGKIIGIIDKNIINGVEYNTSLYTIKTNGVTDGAFTNVNDVNISLYYEDYNTGNIKYLGKHKLPSTGAVVEFKDTVNPITEATLTAKLDLYSKGILLNEFVEIVRKGCVDYLYTRSWFNSTHKTYGISNTNVQADNSYLYDNSSKRYDNDAQRRQEIVKAMANMINMQSSKDMNIEQEFRSDIASDGYEYNVVLAPGYPELTDELIKLSEALQQEVFVIGDTPMHMSVVELIRWGQQQLESSVIATSDNIRSDNRGLHAYYYPHALVRNLDGTAVACPSSALALVAMTVTDNKGNVWDAPAGPARGVLTNVMDIEAVGYVNAKDAVTNASTLGTSSVSFERVRLNQIMKDSLYHNCNINPITDSLQYGMAIWGNKTRVDVGRQMVVDGSMQTVTASALDRVNVARMLMYIRRGVKKIMTGFLFEPNTSITRKTVTNAVTSYLNGIKTSNGLYDFAVLCDDSNNSPADIDQYILNLDLALKPTRVIEFIYVNINVVKTGDEFTF